MRATLAALVLLALSSWGTAAGARAGTAVEPASDLDALMAQVLERRSETWRALHDYVLDERERFDLTGPGGQRLYGTRREFTWFVRDGYLIRSPLRLDGVTPDTRAREEYEARWIREERSREAAKAKKARAAEGPPVEPGVREAGASTEPASLDSTAAIARQGLEPRFISEAYFLGFTFDPGNYYLAGRETLDGRSVLRIEYYPTRLFTDDDAGGGRTGTRESASRDTPARSGKRRSAGGGEAARTDDEEEVERKFNKVALVTLWVDPAERQIVKYTFDNTNLDFLAGRWLVRVGDISASMTMGQYFQGVWLPRALSVHASLTLANGNYEASYTREFFDYRQGVVKARIRSYTPENP